jgi:DMSO/TMAO reductase YedYZ molybdopterin-dependent catalytic subunit
MAERNRGWLKQTFGKKLNKLHKWNAWVILILAVSGMLLYIPSIRGDLGVLRVIMKQVHIYVGLLSIVLIALYSPLLVRHVKQLRNRPGQRFNLGVVLFILIGWSLSGLVLWQLRMFSPIIGSAALFAHDLFSWIGIPYAVYHSLTRLRWIRDDKKRAVRPIAVEYEEVPEGAVAAGAAGSAGVPAEPPRWKQAWDTFREEHPVSRRTFISTIIWLLLLVGIGPKFVKWLFGPVDADVSFTMADQTSDPNAPQALQSLTPLPESNPPIGGGRNGTFRIYTVTEFPQFVESKWKFLIGGLVENPQSWSWEQFSKLERIAQVSDFHCVTGWSVYHITWEGIPLAKFLEQAKVKKEARYVRFYSDDGVYTDTLTLDQAKMNDVMVAVMIDGKPISQKLGGPVRLIVPKMYGYKSVKWLNGIELIDRDVIGFWEERGYDTDAWVRGT